MGEGELVLVGTSRGHRDFDAADADPHRRANLEQLEADRTAEPLQTCVCRRAIWRKPQTSTYAIAANRPVRRPHLGQDQGNGLKVDPNFNQIDALLTAANKALTRAMNAAPVVTKPSDVKALVDAAANALKLIETIRNQSVGKVSREEVAQEIARVLGEVEKARMRDVEEMVEAELKKLGITRSGEGVTVGGAGLVVAVDHDEADVIDDEPPTAAPDVQGARLMVVA
jgi:hypothetical protein